MSYWLLYDMATGAIVGRSMGGLNPFQAPDGHSFYGASEEEYRLAVSLDLSGPSPVPVFGEEQVSIPPKPSGDDIALAFGLYKPLRAAAYDDIGDQIDRITKALEKLHQAGIDIGEAGIEQVHRCAAVKARFPSSPPAIQPLGEPAACAHEGPCNH